MLVRVTSWIVVLKIAARNIDDLTCDALSVKGGVS